MAITQALFKGYEKARDSNNYRVRVQLTDPTKNPTTWEVWLENVTGSTLQEVAQSAAQQIAALSRSETSKDVLAGIAVDTPVPVAPTGPSAGDVADAAWLSNVRLLIRVKNAQAAGLSHAQLTTDLANLTATVNAGYTTARAQKL